MEHHTVLSQARLNTKFQLLRPRARPGEPPKQKTQFRLRKMLE